MTNAKIVSIVPWRGENGEDFFHFHFSFDLAEEDYRLLAYTIKDELEATTGRKMDLEEVLLAVITFGIHRATEEATGKPFVLRMDRKEQA